MHVQTGRDGDWRPATVVAASSPPRSCVVQSPDGSTFRRNRRMLKPAVKPTATPQARQQENSPKRLSPAESSAEDSDQAIPTSEGTVPAVPASEPTPTAVTAQRAVPSPATVRTRSGRAVRLPVRFRGD